jgi:hypothetical protein
LGDPLASLYEIVADVGRSLQQSAVPITDILGQQLLAQDFPAIEADPKKSK